MRLIPIALIAILAIIPSAQGDDIAVARARAKAALDLMQMQRQRDEIKTARTVADFELKKMCKDRECSDDLQESVNRAARSGKPLFVWVGFECKAEPEIRKAFVDAVHCHVHSLNGDSTPRIVAGKVGETFRFERAKFGPKVVDEIKATIAPAKAVSQPAAFFDPFSTSSQRAADGKH